jgi:phosphatidylglycerophosphate synthase
MFDARLRKSIDPVLETIAQKLASLGIGANAVTWLGFAIGVIAALAIYDQSYIWALFLILLSRLCDGLDGTIARLNGKTDLGGYLDIVLDFAFYGIVPLAFIWSSPAENWAAGSVLLAAFYLNGASFLTFALLSEKRGATETQRGSKSFLYSFGLAEAGETLLVFVLFCLFPAWFSLIAYIFACIVLLTTTIRFVQAYDEF